MLNDNVVLTGTVDTPLDAKRAVDLATIFVTGGEATTGQYSQTASGGSANGGVTIHDPDEARRVSKIVNLLEIIGDDQVTLKVTVAEVSRSVMKQLGVNLIGNGSINGISAGAISSPPFGLGKPISQLSNMALGGSGGNGLQAYINAMEQSGVMKTLAEPTLTAVSGEKATFRAGGQFNLITNRTGTGPVTYTNQKIEYGIGLEFQPVVLSAGRISLKVRTSVSEPTTEGASTLEAAGGLPGTTLLSIRKRLADTTVELPSGGSMMIAGLVRDDVRQAVSGLPGLGKIPVLGTLFRSKDFIRNESELVIIITPYLARPVARNDLAKPDDNFNAPSDGAGMFLGRVNRVYGTMQTDKPNGRYHGVVGFIYKVSGEADMSQSASKAMTIAATVRSSRERICRSAIPILAIAVAASLAGCANLRRDSITVGAIPDDYRTTHPIMIAEKNEKIDLPGRRRRSRHDGLPA